LRIRRGRIKNPLHRHGERVGIATTHGKAWACPFLR
jgi:hypothetical protein